MHLQRGSKSLVSPTKIARRVLVSRRISEWPLPLWPGLKNEILAVVVAGLLIAVLALVTSSGSTSQQAVTTSTCGLNSSCPPIAYESYQPCILGYSGFQVVSPFPNPSTWTFTLHEGSTGYIFYQYNVTKGLGFFIEGLNGPLDDMADVSERL